MKSSDKKEIAISALKSIIGEIPFVGSALNEVIDYRSNIKQNRLNNFIEILSQYFSENSVVDIENIKTERFSDIFESIIFNVSKTRSQKKVIHFKNILINELISPSEKIELVEIFIELISNLSEEELIILYNHRCFNKEYDIERERYKTIKSDYKKLKSGKEKVVTKILKEQLFISENINEYFFECENKYENLKKKTTSEYYNLNERDFMFYKQSLFSKGLLKDWGVGRIGTNSFELMSITEFGEEFIKFIIGSEKTVGNTG